MFKAHHTATKTIKKQASGRTKNEFGMSKMYKQLSRITLVLGMMCFGVMGWGQSIFTNPITGTNPNTSNPYTIGQTPDPNIAVSGIGRGSGINGTNANDRYNANGWDTGTLDPTAYFTFTLTPNSGYEIDFVSFVYTGQASGTGATSVALRSSLDGFASNIGSPTIVGTTIDLSGAQFQGVSVPIEFRLYGWGASGSSGTFSVNNFTFNGTVGMPSSATLNTTPTLLDNLNYVEGFGPSAAQSFTVSGSNLDPADATITVAASTNFAVSLAEGGTYTSSVNIDAVGGEISGTPVFTRLVESLPVNSNTGTVKVSGGGASDAIVSVSGEVTAAPMGAVDIDMTPYIYEHNFTGFLGSNDPINWITQNIGDASIWQGTGTGTSLTGGKYSFGDSGSGATFEGSLGFLPTGSSAINAIISFTNNTGVNLTNFRVGYVAEHWRSTLDGQLNGWAVTYSINGGAPVSLEDLSYTAPNNILTGGGPHGSSSLSQDFTTTLAAGQVIEIIFFGDNGTGSGSRQGVAIDNFSFEASDAALPVDLLSFTATPRDKQVHLDWTFDNARGFDRFAIEHATDRQEWAEIGVVHYTETISRSRQAQYTHRSPANGNNYYRLRMIDEDGTEKLSRVQSVHLRKSGGFTPVNTLVDVELFVTRSGSDEAAQLTIVDLQGRVMETGLLPEFEENAQMNLSGLAPGVYLLQVVTSSDRTTFKIVKK